MIYLIALNRQLPGQEIVAVNLNAASPYSVIREGSLAFHQCVQ